VTSRDTRAARLEDLYQQHYGAVWAYARRRVRSAADADDVVAQTWLAVWRRLDDVPEGHELPWCFGVARRCLANHRRSEDRRLKLARRLPVEPTVDATRTLDDEGVDVHRALARLSAADRELLMLVGWEGLSIGDIGVVVGTSPANVSVRLHRARKRFAKHLQDLRAAGHMSITAPITEGT
jgi:RNA polymerase sigma factor (sigma-70 family)